MRKLHNTRRVGTNQKALFECPECGSRKELYVSNASRTKTCGCVDFRTKHGHARKGGLKTLTYGSWEHMKGRCDNPNLREYEWYGGRGISYTPEWADFSNFLEDMGERPGEDYCLGRIDHNKNYCPENTRWELKAENTQEMLARRWHG